MLKRSTSQLGLLLSTQTLRHVHLPHANLSRNVYSRFPFWSMGHCIDAEDIPFTFTALPQVFTALFFMAVYHPRNMMCYTREYSYLKCLLWGSRASSLTDMKTTWGLWAFQYKIVYRIYNTQVLNCHEDSDSTKAVVNGCDSKWNWWENVDRLTFISYQTLDTWIYVWLALFNLNHC